MPKISSIAVTKALPIMARFKRLEFLNFSPILAKNTKQVPPAKSIDGWVCPRHKISISPYPHAPMGNIKKFAFFISSPKFIMGDNSLYMQNRRRYLRRLFVSAKSLKSCANDTKNAAI